MVELVEVVSSEGTHSLGLSDWGNSVTISFRKDGRISVFGYSLLADDRGDLRKSRVFSRVKLKSGAELAKAIQGACEETGCDSYWAPDEEIVAVVSRYSARIGSELRQAWFG